VPATVSLSATDADGNALTYRIVSQPANGTVSLSGTSATYFPFTGFTGPDTFTYAAWDGSIDSNLATVTVAVTSGPPCTISATASAPTTAPVGTAVAFTASAAASNCSGAVTYDWNFGDGVHASTQNASHAYTSVATFGWSMTASAGGVNSVRNGSIVVSSAPATAAPTITRVRALSRPFAIEITGTGFQVGVQVFIGTDTTAWTPTTRSSSTTVLLTGSGLSARFPPGTAVPIRVTNPGDGSASTTFTRRR